MAKSVNYEIVEAAVDLNNVPDSTGGRSVLEDQLDKIRGMEQGKFYRIALYNKNSAAASARKALEGRHGPENIDGYVFRTYHETDGRYGLYARFNAATVNAEAAKSFHDAQNAAAKARRATAKTEREKATAPGVNTGSAEQVQETKAPEDKQKAAAKAS